jgi:ABC-2 type transport system ATP-binding protein
MGRGRRSGSDMEQHPPDRDHRAPASPAPDVADRAVDLIGLCVGFGATPALEGINLRVREGEIFGLVGREGAGKSVLLRSVVGHIEPSAGAISVFGAPPGAPESRARVAFLPDRFRPPGDLSGYEFLRVTLLMHGGSLDPAVVRNVARSLDLEPGDLGRRVHECGKGIAQKLGLLAMLLTDRPLLILDEPLSGLTPDARAKVKQALIAYRDRGRTVLLASDIASDHEGLCDRIAILRAGRLGYVGSIADLCGRLGAPTLTTALLADRAPV